MKTSSKIAIAAAAVGAWLLAKKKQSVSGIGGANDHLLPTVSEYSRYLDIAQNKFGISREQARKRYGLYTIGQWNKLLGIGSTSISPSVLNMAKRLFDNYDRLVEIEREHDEKCDAIYESFEARGIDPFADENERMVIDALYQAGLTDENGMTDVTTNRLNARKQLYDFVNENIVTIFPIPASDRKLLSDTKNVVYQNRLLDITRDFVNKQLEHRRNIREILNGGIGKVDHSDYDGARIITKDGLHAISFDIYGRGENGITVTAEMKGGGERYGFSWEYLSHIGEYKTLSGAIKAANKYAMMHGWVFDSDDFEKL